MSEDEIRQYFSRFGNVGGVELPFDRQRNRRREFCFILFDTEEAAEAALKEPKQTIGNKECDIKKAQPQSGQQQQKRTYQQNYSQDGGAQGGNRYGNNNGGRRFPKQYHNQSNWNGYSGGAGAQAASYYGNYYGMQQLSQ